MMLPSFLPRLLVFALALLAGSLPSLAWAQSQCLENEEVDGTEQRGRETIFYCRCVPGYVRYGENPCQPISARVHIWIKAFIPNQHPGNPGYVRPAPWSASKWIISGPPGQDCFETDHRWFSANPTASARITSETVLAIEGKSILLLRKDGRELHRADLSYQVNCRTGAEVEPPRRSNTNSMRFGAPALGIRATASFSVSASANNPLVRGSPAIDFSGTFTFHAKMRELAFEGTVGAFPAFEAYAALGNGPPVMLFQHEPAPGSTVWNLLDLGVGLNTRKISARVTLR